jgi:hypothetical protein
MRIRGFPSETARQWSSGLIDLFFYYYGRFDLSIFDGEIMYTIWQGREGCPWNLSSRKQV